MNYGILTLVPTPLSEEGVLCAITMNTLLDGVNNKALFVVEDLKPARRRWLSFGLPRECIADFLPLNEHSVEKATFEILSQLKSGRPVFVMSDGGLPAFFDPGQKLVSLCHQEKIKVTATPFFNSIALAVALSGLPHQRFVVEGFLPKEGEERGHRIKEIYHSKGTKVILDTPYRLERFLSELSELEKINKRKIFLALDLNRSSEECFFDFPSIIKAQLKASSADLKREFVVVL